MLELLASVLDTATTVSGGTATFGPCPQVSRKYKTENTNKMYAEYLQMYGSYSSSWVSQCQFVLSAETEIFKSKVKCQVFDMRLETSCE